MKIVNTATGKIIAKICTNHSICLDDAINLVGEICSENEEENVQIFDNWYYYEDLALIDEE